MYLRKQIQIRQEFANGFIDKCNIAKCKRPSLCVDSCHNQPHSSTTADSQWTGSQMLHHFCPLLNEVENTDCIQDWTWPSTTPKAPFPMTGIQVPGSFSPRSHTTNESWSFLQGRLTLEFSKIFSHWRHLANTMDSPLRQLLCDL